MAAPMVLPFQWQPAWPNALSIEVRLVPTDHGPMFFAEDVCRALGLEVDAYRWRNVSDGTAGIRRIYPGHPELHADLLDEEGEPEPVYTVPALADLFAARPFPYVAEFARWLAEISTPYKVTLEEMFPAHDEEPSTLTAVERARADETFSIALAAKYLSRDPQLQYGRDTLFHALRDLGWVSRDREVWIPAHEQLVSGNLIRHRSRLPGARKDAFPQVRLTVKGIEALHRALGGVALLNIDNDADLTLLEI